MIMSINSYLLIGSMNQGIGPVALLIIVQILNSFVQCEDPKPPDVCASFQATPAWEDDPNLDCTQHVAFNNLPLVKSVHCYSDGTAVCEGILGRFDFYINTSNHTPTKPAKESTSDDSVSVILLIATVLVCSAGVLTIWAYLLMKYWSRDCRTIGASTTSVPNQNQSTLVSLKGVSPIASKLAQSGGNAGSRRRKGPGHNVVGQVNVAPGESVLPMDVSPVAVASPDELMPQFSPDVGPKLAANERNPYNSAESLKQIQHIPRLDSPALGQQPPRRPPSVEKLVSVVKKAT